MAHLHGDFCTPAMNRLRQIAQGEVCAGIGDPQHKGLGRAGFRGDTGFPHGDKGHAAFGEFLVKGNGAGRVAAVVVYLAKIHGGHTDAVFQGHIADLDGGEQIGIIGIH